jgi:hypothetical protein
MMAAPPGSPAARPARFGLMWEQLLIGFAGPADAPPLSSLAPLYEEPTE